MTPSEFNSLSLQDRATALWPDGRLLETIEYYNYRVSLYALHTFFVELYYSPDQNIIEKIEAADQAALAKFINRINLDELE